VFGSVLQVLLGKFLGDYATLLTYVVMFIPPMLYAASASGKNSFMNDGIKLNSANFGRLGGLLCALLAILAAVSANFISDAVSRVLPPMPERLRYMLESMVKGNFLSNFLCVCICAPFFEEWLCRGMVLRGLLGRGVKPTLAIVVSACFFALIHFNPWQAIPAFIFGCVMGFVYYRTGSLLLTMLIHFVNNFSSLAVVRLFPGIESIESWADIMSPEAYSVTIALSVLVLIGCIAAFCRIELKQPSGNLDLLPCIYQ
ncbi:MAG: CPBP family intramembrane metalloprotease, partial [Bacteroidales bacterium]|nr:CPBP family intramembrane metalloprotease [Bacteroidales bacterium]